MTLQQAVGPLLWRWVALAECLWSQAVAALVNPDTQDKPTQDDISTTAVRHAGAAARWAAIAKDPVLALTIARYCVRSCEHVYAFQSRALCVCV